MYADVPPMDTFEGMSDLFVKCWPEGVYVLTVVTCMIDRWMDVWMDD